MKKRGQTIMGMSFGVIFSIILIIVIIGVAVYAIVYFIGLKNCSEIGLFYNDFQGEIDRAWTSGIYQGTFGQNANLPGGINQLCLGNLTAPVALGFSAAHSDAEYYYSGSGAANIFLLPYDKGCGEIFSNVLTHVKIDEFSCIPVQNGKVSIQLNKDVADSLVKLTI